MLETSGSRFKSSDSKNRLSVLLGVTVVCLLAAVVGGVGDARAYNADDPWALTASGTPQTLTWGFADDGTLIPANGSSDLIRFLDGVFSVVPPIGNLTERPWFSLFEESFDRWSQVSGISFVYEGADDGSTLQSSPGVLGVRADIRIAGKFIDGPSGATAATWLPDTGDIVLDTGDAAYFALALTGNVRPRNTLSHEIGHALGLMHVASSNAALLMEPMTATSLNGPQLDDIRGMQSLYGDFYEKTNGGLGNDTATRATNLGSLSVGSSLVVGSDAEGDQVVISTEKDFASITDATDVDFYSFTISAPGLLRVSLTPWGGVFNHGVPGGQQEPLDAASENNLSVAVLGSNGATLLALANNAGAGATETIAGLELASAGRYYVRVLGASDAVQLYELDLMLTPPGHFLAGDFDSDGTVSGSDFLLWQRSLGSTGTNLAADGNGDGTVDAADLAIWQSHFGETVSPRTIVGVPEPHCATLLSLALATASALGMRRRLR